MAEREAYWRLQFAQWLRSGLSIRSFCRKHGHFEPGFRLWLRAVSANDRNVKRRKGAGEISRTLLPGLGTGELRAAGDELEAIALPPSPMRCVQQPLSPAELP